jgi:hypothetical protein
MITKLRVVAALVAAVVFGLWLARRNTLQMTRVGGAMNQCTCTQRIEP